MSLLRASVTIAVLLGWSARTSIASDGGAGSRDPGGEWQRLRPAVSYYFAPGASDQATSVRLDVVDLNTFCAGPQPLLVKLMDARGEVHHRSVLPDDGVAGGPYQQAWGGWDHELWAHGALRDAGVEPLFDADAFAAAERVEALPRRLVKIELPAGAPRPMELQVVGGADHVVRVVGADAASMGRMGHPDWLDVGAGEHRFFAFVPARPAHVKPDDALHVWLRQLGWPRDVQLTVRRVGAGNAEALAFAAEGQAEATRTMTAGGGLGRFRLEGVELAAGEVLQFDARSSRPFLLRVGGVPAILCATPEAAQSIAGAQPTAPGVPPVALPHQADLWRWLLSLKREDVRPTVTPGGWYQPTPQALRSIRTLAWLNTRDPQKVDPTLKQVVALANRDATFDAMAFVSALNISPAALEDLIFFYLVPLEGNALYRDRVVGTLITAAISKAWLGYRQSDVIYSPAEINLAYAQGFHWRYWHATWLMIDHAPGPVATAWRRAASRAADRMAFANDIELVNTNGRTTIPLNLWLASQVTGEPHLAELADTYLNRIVTRADGPRTGQSPAGYFHEHFGPEGGYATYPLYQLGLWHSMTPRDDVLAAMDRLCRWVCHVSFPEGQGLIGPSSWNARIAQSAGEHLWGDGHKFIAGVSPWAARLYHRHANTRTVEPQPDPPLVRPLDAKAATLMLAPLTRTVLPAADLPCESTEPRLEDLGDGGFFAANRGDYYAITFAGARPPFWMDHMLGGPMGFSGGGLTGLYIRGVGAVLLGRAQKDYGTPAAHWDALAAPVVVGRHANGQRFNTGVCRVAPTLDREAWRLTSSGEAIGAPVRFERRYTFHADHIAAVVTVADAQLHRDVFQYQEHFNPPAVGVPEAWEVLPLFVREGWELTAAGGDNAEVDLANEPSEGVTRLRLRGPIGGLDVELAQPARVMFGKGTHTAVYVELAASEGGAVRQIAYKLTPVR